MALAFLVLALAAGGALPFQAGINARLATFVGGPIRASAISFAVGTVVLLLLALIARAGVPTVMLFVQSLRGLSHTKLEDTTDEHIELRVREAPQALDEQHHGRDSGARDLGRIVQRPARQ